MPDLDPIRERQPQPYNLFNDREEIVIPQQQREQAMLQIGAAPLNAPLLQIEPEVAVPIEAEPFLVPPVGGGFPGMPPGLRGSRGLRLDGPAWRRDFDDWLRVGGFRRGVAPEVFDPIPRPLAIEAAREARPAAPLPPDAPVVPVPAPPPDAAYDPDMVGGIFAGLPPRAEYRRRGQPVAVAALPAPYEWQTQNLAQQYANAAGIAEQNDVVTLDRQLGAQRAVARRYEQDLTRAGIENDQKAQIARENQLIQDGENRRVRDNQRVQDDKSIDEIFAPMEAKEEAAAKKIAEAREDQDSGSGWSREDSVPGFRAALGLKESKRVIGMSQDYWMRRDKENQNELMRADEAKLARDEAAGAGARAPRERGLQPQLPMSIFAYNLPPNVTGRTRERRESLGQPRRGELSMSKLSLRDPTKSEDDEAPARSQSDDLFAQQSLSMRNPDDLQRSREVLPGWDESNVSVGSNRSEYGGGREIADSSSLSEMLSELD